MEQNILSIEKVYPSSTSFIIIGIEKDFLLYCPDYRRIINDILFTKITNDNEPYWIIYINGRAIYKQKENVKEKSNI